jgi:hypothetical protein
MMHHLHKEGQSLVETTSLQNPRFTSFLIEMTKASQNQNQSKPDGPKEFSPERGARVGSPNHQRTNPSSVSSIQNKAHQRDANETPFGQPCRRRPTKKNQILRMLRSDDGTTISDIIKATGWQSHSIRAFFSAVVRRQLQLHLRTRKMADHKIYFLDD